MVLGAAGVGLVLQQDLIVISVNAGGPASLSNVEVGDRIVEVDGKKVEGWSIDAVAQLICGEAATQVEVTLEKKVRAAATITRRHKLPASVVGSMPASQLHSRTAAGREGSEPLERNLRVAKQEIALLTEKLKATDALLSVSQSRARHLEDQLAEHASKGPAEGGPVSVTQRGGEERAEAHSHRGQQGTDESGLAKLKSDVERLVAQGWEAVKAREQVSNDGAFGNLFREIDKDGDGIISSSELEAHVQTLPPDQIVDSMPLRSLRAHLAQPQSPGVTLPEFQEVVKDIYKSKYSSMCAAAKFGTALEDALMDTLIQGQLADEGSSLLPLRSLARLEPKERAAVLMEHCLAVLPEVTAALVLIVSADDDYDSEQGAIADPEGKFNNSIVLTDHRVFHLGLEKLIGFPVYSSDDKILEQMEREHTEGAHAGVEFWAWNDRVHRKTAPATEWSVVMPEGWQGPVYGRDYMGNQEHWVDFMQHETVIKAGMKKYEVVAVRLYTGPMFAPYNNFMRMLGQLSERYAVKVKEEAQELRARLKHFQDTVLRAAEHSITDTQTQGTDENGDEDVEVLAVLDGVEGEARVDSADATLASSWSTRFSYKMACPAGSKAYFEVIITGSPENVALGFATAAVHRSTEHARRGSEATKASWTVQAGARLHDGRDHVPYTASWCTGDIIGVACDLVSMEVMVSVNGSADAPNGLLFQLKSDAALFPVIDVKRGEVRYNFGDDETRPFEGRPAAWADFVSVREAARALDKAAVRAAVRTFDEERRLVAGASVCGSRGLVGQLIRCYVEGDVEERSALVVAAETVKAAVEGRWVEREEAELILEESVDKMGSADKPEGDEDEGSADNATADKGRADAWAVERVRASAERLCKAVEDEEAVLEEAVKRARIETGTFPYATTVHAINSALIKVARITPLPPGGKVFRGMAGVKMSQRFLEPNEFGSRVGNEMGFMSTTTNMAVAIGYMDATKRYKQLFEIEAGQIDHGADIDFLSLFPGEREMLFPPNSCLEVVGAARFEYSDKGLVKVWPLCININLGGRTIEDFQATRKELLVEAAESSLNEVLAMLSLHKTLPATRRRMAELGNDDEETVDKMLTNIRKQSTATVNSLRKRPQEHFNDDSSYKLAYEEVTDLKPLATCVLDLWSSEYHQWDAWALKSIPLHDARQALAEQTAKQLEEAKAEAEDEDEDGGEEVRALARRLARIRKLYSRDLEARDAQGFTPLMYWCHEGYVLGVRLLLDAGADVHAITSDRKETALHLAVRQGHAEVVREWVARKLPLDTLDHIGESALYAAAEANKVAMVEALVEGGATLDLKCCEEEESALYTAAIQQHTQVVRLLAEARASLNMVPKRGQSALRHAVERKRTDMVRLLQELGAADLHAAAKLDDAPMVQRCLARGADVDELDNNGHTALGLAVQNDAAAAAVALAEGGAGLELEKTSKHALRRAVECKAAATVAALRGCGVADLHAAALLDDDGMVRDCLERGVSVGIKDREGATALSLAAKHNAAAAVQALAAGGARLDDKGQGERTALREAIEGKHSEAEAALLACGAMDLHSGALKDDAGMVQACLDAGADVDQVDGKGMTALWMAATADAAQAIEILTKGGARLDITCGKRKQTVLAMTVDTGKAAAVAALVAAGAKDLQAAAHLNDAAMAQDCVAAAEEADVERALELAVQKGSVAVVCVLLDSGVDIDTQDKREHTALHHAVRFRQPEVLAELLQRGADTEIVGEKGTALHIAATIGSVDMVKALLAGGASTSSLDDGRTALQSAAEEGQAGVVAALVEGGADAQQAMARDKRAALHIAVEEDKLEVVHALLAGGAVVDVEDKDLKTPLHLAAAANRVQHIQALLAGGASTELEDDDGRTALFAAVEEGQLEAVKALLDSGATMGLVGCGATPLNEALLREHDAIASSLLDANAPIHVADEETGNTPLVVASYFGKKELVERLLELRADVNTKTKEGKAALRYAEEQGHDDTATVLRHYVRP